jgi:hypothetical protein
VCVSVAPTTGRSCRSRGSADRFGLDQCGHVASVPFSRRKRLVAARHDPNHLGNHRRRALDLAQFRRTPRLGAASRGYTRIATAASTRNAVASRRADFSASHSAAPGTRQAPGAVCLPEGAAERSLRQRAGFSHSRDGKNWGTEAGRAPTTGLGDSHAEGREGWSRPQGSRT